MGLVEHGVGEGAEPIRVDGLNMRRAFDAVGGRPVGGNVERLARVLGPIEVIGTKDLVLGVQIVVYATEERSVSYLVEDRQAIVLFEVALHEVQKDLTLTIATGSDLGVRD